MNNSEFKEKYPQLSKRSDLGMDYTKVVDLVVWLKHKYQFGVWQGEEFWPTHLDENDVVNQYFDLDTKKISDETEMLLKEVQEQLDQPN